MSFDQGVAPCYHPNGTVLPTTGFFDAIRPCPGAGLSSICCAWNRDVAPGANITDFRGWAADECLPNGLCENRHVKDDEQAQTFWLEYCTEPDLDHPRCLDVCRGSRDSGGGTVMTPCDGTRTSERWCCGGSNSCCSNNEGVVTLAANFTGGLLPVSTSSRTSTSSATLQITGTGTTQATQATAAPAATTSPSSSQATASTSSESSSLTTGAKAGIGLGVALGIIALLCLALFFLRRRHKKNPYGYDQDLKNKEIYEHRMTPPSELPSEGTISELPSPPVELPGHDVGGYKLGHEVQAHEVGQHKPDNGRGMYT